MRLQTVEAWGYQCACRRCVDDWRRLHIHEEPPRAHGGDPFDPLDCMPLSASCHAKRTGELGKGRTLTISRHPTLRCRGPLIFRESTGFGCGDSWVTVPWSGEIYHVDEYAALVALAERGGGE